MLLDGLIWHPIQPAIWLQPTTRSLREAVFPNSPRDPIAETTPNRTRRIAKLSIHAVTLELGDPRENTTVQLNNPNDIQWKVIADLMPIGHRRDKHLWLAMKVPHL